MAEYGMRIVAAVFGMIAAVLACGAARAQDATTSKQEVIDRLTPSKPATRSLRPDVGLSEGDKQFLQSLPKTRSLREEERYELEAVVKRNDLPSIDITVSFDFNSAAITPAAAGALQGIGEALADSALSNAQIYLNGHTDASGSDEFNQRLSELRAISVRDHLLSSYHIHPRRLVVAGSGEKSLKDPTDPNSAINRRVEVVNLIGG